MERKVRRALSDGYLADTGPDIAGTDGFEKFVEKLPPDYARLLREVNGFSFNGGMNRVFGVRSDPHLDAQSWNEEHRWRFAWNGKADSYFFFGGTAFGDQYAFRGSVQAGAFDEGVYLLDANLLAPELVADSFEEFLEKEIVQNARESWDPLVSACLETFGRLEIESHLVLTPSLLLGGVEDVSNMIKMDGFTAMIYGGDINAAIMGSPDEAVVVGVEPWIDAKNRQRVRIVFAD